MNNETQTNMDVQNDSENDQLLQATQEAGVSVAEMEPDVVDDVNDVSVEANLDLDEADDAQVEASEVDAEAVADIDGLDKADDTEPSEQIESKLDQLSREIESATDLLTAEETSKFDDDNLDTAEANLDVADGVVEESVVGDADLSDAAMSEVIDESMHQVMTEFSEAKPDWSLGRNYHKSLMAYHDRGSKIAEEYRALRTNLLSKYATDRFCMMVTSAEHNEGKSVTCLNLAFSLAERTDRRTIVVDGDLRHGGIGGLLGVRSDIGVAEVLEGRVSVNEAINSTVYPNVSFLSAGRVEPGQAGELISRSSLKSLIADLRDRYDYVLVDTPAVNHYSDAGMAGLITNDTLMVVRMNKTPKEAVKRAMQSLKAMNVNIVGMLLTHRKNHLFC